MNAKINKTISAIIPSKKINLFLLFIIFLGVISGSIFLVLTTSNDKTIIINQITNFITNINSNNISSIDTLKNSILINFTYIMIIFILGMSIIGIIFNIFLIYIKGFVIGFSITSLIYVYGIKGILASIFYILPHQLLNIFAILIIGIYSIIFTINLYKLIIGSRVINFKHFLKKYLVILGICLFISFVSSILETFLTPALFKLFIKLFI